MALNLEFYTQPIYQSRVRQKTPHIQTFKNLEITSHAAFLKIYLHTYSSKATWKL